MVAPVAQGAENYRVGIGKQLRDEIGFGRYVRQRILPLAPPFEPAPFRGFIGEGDEPFPFLEEIESWLAKRRPGAFNVLGASGSGKTLFARWAAARWGQRFLDEPDLFPLPLWVEAKQLSNLSPDGALTVAHLA